MTAELAEAIRRAGVAEVDASARRRAEYSTDASLYRVPPELVVFPRDLDEVVAVVETCLALGVPLTARGAGTSIAGNAVGPGVVMDMARHLRRVRSLDPEAATATVEPGVVLDDLQAAARPHGLRFGPDPSTHSRCTLGGMLGNNACGSRALAYGRTADNVLELEVVWGTGQRLLARPGVALADVKQVHSIPVATAQCHRYLRENRPEAEILADEVRPVGNGVQGHRRPPSMRSVDATLES